MTMTLVRSVVVVLVLLGTARLAFAVGATVEAHRAELTRATPF